MAMWAHLVRIGKGAWSWRRKTRMMLGMGCSGHEFKILQGIIALVAIFMMDNFMGR